MVGITFMVFITFMGDTLRARRKINRKKKKEKTSADRPSSSTRTGSLGQVSCGAQRRDQNEFWNTDKEMQRISSN